MHELLLNTVGAGLKCSGYRKKLTDGNAINIGHKEQSYILKVLGTEAQLTQASAIIAKCPFIPFSEVDEHYRNYLRDKNSLARLPYMSEDALFDAYYTRFPQSLINSPCPF
ncbi:hypothetical protein [Neptuniibacter sp. QD37_11]|uniref:hypothetical protein n=1 Tax=Neptuniibacter sp. QD37_11 TaxID=3398209 RepID=UPI0039F63298